LPEEDACKDLEVPVKALEILHVNGGTVLEPELSYKSAKWNSDLLWMRLNLQYTYATLTTGSTQSFAISFIIISSFSLIPSSNAAALRERVARAACRSGDEYNHIAKSTRLEPKRNYCQLVVELQRENMDRDDKIEKVN
jgi:hypothetical protein